MCGIAGYFKNNSKKIEVTQIISKMNDLQIHRGPDSHDKYLNSENNLGLIMCRLSILDLELGTQPMTSKNGRYTIIFNGTILNSPELRIKLEAAGIIFHTNNSDTEVLLQMMITYGIDSLKELNGSFAFAFYDDNKKKLLCARDRFGLAPFYYQWKNGRFVFASELKSILGAGFSSTEIDLESLSNYLSLLWVPGPKTIIKDINKLSAGHFIELNLKEEVLVVKKWWDIEFNPPENKMNLNEWTEEIKNTLEKSVKRSTLSDVPLACGLSGGLDSQALTGLLFKNNIKTNTFTLGFKGHNPGNLNEMKVAKVASEHFKTNHTEMIIDTKDYFDDLDKMVYHLDEPYGGGLPIWHVLKEAGKKFGVILTGLGGDELFGNFGRWTLLEKTQYDFFKSSLQFDTLFFNRKYFFTEELKNKLLNNNTKHSTSKYLQDIVNDKKLKNIRDKIMFLDIKTQLQDEYCNVVNKFSMANQIEARAPFLDNEFSNLMFSVPSDVRTNKKDFKYLLRKAMENIIPKENLNNRKIGFVGLESQKINYNFNELKNNLFNEKKIITQGIFNYKFLEEFIVSFQNKGFYKERIGIFTKIYSFKSLWALIMFQKWYDIFISKNDNFKFNLDG